MLSLKKAFLISLSLTILFFLIDLSKISGYFLRNYEIYLVYKVIDGDTIELSNGEKVRLLGINAPEVGEKYYEEARDFLSNLIEGKEVILETDLEKKDNYGRKLAFVFLGDLNINVEMVKSGLAHTYKLNKISKYKNELEKAEALAMSSEVGIWKKSNISCIKLIDLKIYGEEKVVIKNDCNFTIQLNNWTLEDESHNRFTFPPYLFKEGETIEIYTMNKTARFTFRKNFPIWNRDGDSLFLRDSQGLLVLFYRY